MRLRSRLRYLHTFLVGRWGEGRAAAYLEQHFFKIWKRNWRASVGEIDIIAIQNRTIVFVEVKTRSLRSANFLAPIEGVNDDKLRRIKRTARKFVRSHRRELLRRRIQKVRVDVIGVVGDGPLRFWKRPSITHYIDL